MDILAPVGEATYAIKIKDFKNSDSKVIKKIK